MKFMHRTTLAGVLLLATTLLILEVGSSHGQPVAPNFTLTDLNRRRFALSDFRGRIVLMDFFATWCRPCREEIPHLKALSKAYPNDTLMIISIDVDPILDTELAVRKWVQEYEMTWIVVPPSMDSAGVANKYQVIEIPTLILVDQEGYIRERYVGLTEERILRSRIDVIIPEFGTLSLVMTLSLATALLLLRKGKHRLVTYASSTQVQGQHDTNIY